MNYAMIKYMLGCVSCFEATFLIFPCLVALIYGEKRAGLSFLAGLLICAFIGFLLRRKKPKNRIIYAREGMIIVSLSWIVLSALGAIPFYLSGEFPSLMDAIFETVSGFTTTGGSVLLNVEALSYTCLFWRSFTQWIGGMGVLVLVLAILPARSSGTAMHIMRAESPGPSVGKLVPRLRTTALILYFIYLGLTVIEIIMLLLGGVSFFDALTISFATAGTGGFGARSDSLMGYSMFAQGVVLVFMIAFGVSFHFYFLLLKRKFRQAFRSTELLAYFGIIIVSALVITVNIRPMFENVLKTLHHAFFQVAAIITTTGFATAEFDQWPETTRTILLILMFIGACSGSTAGGIKVSRIVILLKGVKSEVSMLCHPRGIKKIKMDGRVLGEETVQSVNAFMAVYVVFFLTSLMLLSIEGKDMLTNFTAVAATISNIGVDMVGPGGNFAQFSNFSKIVLMFNMLAGRLELIPMLMLFIPDTWKR